MTSPSTNLPLSHLTATIAQSTPSDGFKLGLTITLRNTHPAQTFSLIKWDSPLDPLAVPLGIVQFYGPGSDKPLDLPTIAIRRMMPPPRDTLVTLAPGEIQEQKLEIGEPQVDLDSWFGKGAAKGKGSDKGKARVGLRGQWSAVWVGAAKDISDESLESMGGDANAMRGSFEVRPVEVQRPGSGDF